MRIIFVGMHNKPGLPPLCSTTRSGKLIDRIIEKINGFEIVKTNLFDCDYLPPVTSTAAYDWAHRVGYVPGDIVITLGETVHSCFRKTTIKFIRMGHPSGVWSHEKQRQYIERALNLIQDKK
jgi:hypothetical protein